jgi:hypothetical protein
MDHSGISGVMTQYYRSSGLVNDLARILAFAFYPLPISGRLSIISGWLNYVKWVHHQSSA